MKIMPIWRALKARSELEVLWLHTGQHSDLMLSGAFFDQLFSASPDVDLSARSDRFEEIFTHVEARYSKWLDGQSHRPEIVFVPGDVASSVAVAEAAARRDIAVCHVEAGLRSPWGEIEDKHRRRIDAVSAYLLTHSDDADANLLAEGHAPNDIWRVGNFMIDTMRIMGSRIDESKIRERLALNALDYVVFTIHHRENIASTQRLHAICDGISRLARSHRVIFPAHYHARARLIAANLLGQLEDAGVILLDPLPYADFVRLVRDCSYVVTDSDGVQEECAYLKKICFVVRDATARPVTERCGSSILIKPTEVADAPDIFANVRHTIQAIALWDGRATERLMARLEKEELLGLGASDGDTRRRRA